jgi:hypothetical protein
MQQLIRWINPPNWNDLLEQTQGRRSPHTAEWFLEEDTVQHWLSRHNAIQSAPRLNALFTQGTLTTSAFSLTCE